MFCAFGTLPYKSSLASLVRTVVYHEIFRPSIAVAIHRTDAAMGELFKNFEFWKWAVRSDR